MGGERKAPRDTYDARETAATPGRIAMPYTDAYGVETCPYIAPATPGCIVDAPYTDAYGVEGRSRPAPTLPSHPRATAGRPYSRDLWSRGRPSVTIVDEFARLYLS